MAQLPVLELQGSKIIGSLNTMFRTSAYMDRIRTDTTTSQVEVKIDMLGNRSGSIQLG